MGLTLHFRLRLPGDVRRGDVETRLGQLRDVAAAKGLEEVTPVVESLRDDHPDDGLASARACIRFFAECIAEYPRHCGGERYVLDVDSAIGFRVNAGEGVDTATFALAKRRIESDGREEWYWSCSCKTQYASLVSDEHFVRMHTALVAILDAAIEIGFGVEVGDEGGYWESRSVEGLAAEVTRMNRIVAKFGGALSDAIGDEHDIQAPIFQHRRFERLEMGE